MAYFTKQEVRNYAKRSITASVESYSSKLESIVESQNNQRQFDVFLSHSIRDEELVLGNSLYVNAYRIRYCGVSKTNG